MNGNQKLETLYCKECKKETEHIVSFLFTSGKTIKSCEECGLISLYTKEDNKKKKTNKV